MFTIKFYSGDGCRQIIREAESFTILRSPCPFGENPGSAEITLHQKSGESCRIDIGDDGPNGAKRPEGWPPVFVKAIIENSAGRTTEIVGMLGPNFRPSSPPPPNPYEPAKQRVNNAAIVNHSDPHATGHRDRRSA